MSIFIPEIISALLTMGVFSVIVVLIFMGIHSVTKRVQAARRRRKLAGTRFLKAKEKLEETKKHE